MEHKLTSGQYFEGFSNEVDVKKFQYDFDLVWNNAMAYNVEGSWIYKDAITMKKFANRQIETAFRAGKKNATAKESAYSARSMYYDPNSSEDDDAEPLSGAKASKLSSRQRSSFTTTSNPAAAIEPIVRMSLIEESLPVDTDGSAFTLPESWSVHHRSPIVPVSTTSAGAVSSSMRISRRAAAAQQSKQQRSGARKNNENPLASVLYLTTISTGSSSSAPVAVEHVACDRQEVEAVRELLHESYYAKEFQKRWKDIVKSAEAWTSKAPSTAAAGEMDYNTGITNEDEMMDIEVHADRNIGSSSIPSFANNVFPPWLGSVAHGRWEIRPPYINSAVQWVLRGLVESGHIIETDELGGGSNGAVMLANAYWRGYSAFDVLDDGNKRAAAVKKSRKAEEEEALERQKEKEASEMGEYERMRAERVARNQERLKALGLG